ATSYTYTLSLHDGSSDLRPALVTGIPTKTTSGCSRTRCCPPWIAAYPRFSKTSTAGDFWTRRWWSGWATWAGRRGSTTASAATRSEEHTSELQSPDHLVC